MTRLLKFFAAAIVFFLVFGTGTSKAQVYIGAEAGASISWIRGTVVYGYEKVLPHNSGFVGAWGEYHFDSPVIVHAGLVYSGKGHSDVSEEDGKYVRNLSYLQIPLMVGFKVADEKFSIMFGPQPGLLVRATTLSNQKLSESTDECKRFNLALGIQMTYMMFDNFGVELKYDFGLTNTFSGKFMGQQNTGNNMTVMLGLCYRFEP